MVGLGEETRQYVIHSPDLPLPDAAHVTCRRDIKHEYLTLISYKPPQWVMHFLKSNLELVFRTYELSPLIAM